MRFKQFYLVETTFEQFQFKGWKDYQKRIPMVRYGVDILKKLEKHGKAYIVGGTVRDIITGEKVPDDIDIATDVPMEKIESMFKTHDVGKNKDFGIVVIEYKGVSFEIAQFRKDGVYKDGRRPETVSVGVSFDVDAQRRDFTINAMGIDSKGNIIDFFNGTKAIRNKIIQSVGDPDDRFSEDYLRMLRATRFASRLGFNIEDKTKKAIVKNAEKIRGIAPERIMKEIFKMAQQTGGKFANAILKLKETDLLKHIFPEVAKMDEFEHSQETHPEGNAFDHTIAALKSNKLKNPILNLSILLHDVGKITTRTYENGKVRYLHHAKSSADLIDKIADRMKLDNKVRKSLVFSALNHMKMHDFLKMSNNKIYKMMIDDNWNILFSVALADGKARGKIFNEREWQKIVEKIEYLSKKFKDKKGRDAIAGVVNGKLVMKLLKMEPGPKVGEVIRNTVDWILDQNVDIRDTKKINNYIQSTFGGK